MLSSCPETTKVSPSRGGEGLGVDLWPQAPPGAGDGGWVAGTVLRRSFLLGCPASVTGCTHQRGLFLFWTPGGC